MVPSRAGDYFDQILYWGGGCVGLGLGLRNLEGDGACEANNWGWGVEDGILRNPQHSDAMTHQSCQGAKWPSPEGWMDRLGKHVCLTDPEAEGC
jgi:hypothetical protein